MKVGIITIHRIYNYGSVLQTFALQVALEKLGVTSEIIDYVFPNEFHRSHKNIGEKQKRNSFRYYILKMLYAKALFRQHKGIERFLHTQIQLSQRCYNCPIELQNNPPLYDVYVTGSDQVWNPKHCNLDPAFFLQFAPNGKKRISYAASIGRTVLNKEEARKYKDWLNAYSFIGVREKSGTDLLKKLLPEKTSVCRTVLDPTLLLSKEEWGNMAISPSQRSPYILCYYLNYSFDAFPYVDELASHIKKLTGYKIIRVARPPMSCSSLFSSHYKVGASPEEFLGLIKNAAVVLTTSFHGTAFALNFERPLFTIVEKKGVGDTRQEDLLNLMGLHDRVLEKGEPFPGLDRIECNYEEVRVQLQKERCNSIEYLKEAIYDSTL